MTYTSTYIVLQQARLGFTFDTKATEHQHHGKVRADRWRTTEAATSWTVGCHQSNCPELTGYRLHPFSSQGFGRSLAKRVDKREVAISLDLDSLRHRLLDCRMSLVTSSESRPQFTAFSCSLLKSGRQTLQLNHRTKSCLSVLLNSGRQQLQLIHQVTESPRCLGSGPRGRDRCHLQLPDIGPNIPQMGHRRWDTRYGPAGMFENGRHGKDNWAAIPGQSKKTAKDCERSPNCRPDSGESKLEIC